MSPILHYLLVATISLSSSHATILKPAWTTAHDPTGQWNAALLWWDNTSFPVYPTPTGGSATLFRPWPQPIPEYSTNSSVQSFGDTISGHQNANDTLRGVIGRLTTSFDSQGAPSFNLVDFIAAKSWYTYLPGDRKFNNTVGQVQLNPWTNLGADADPGITGYLAARRDIDSPSYGLHIGNGRLGLPGSLVFGGYEQNRAIGEPGMFDITSGLSRIDLHDIVLGVQEGASPFARELNITETASLSVWQGLGRNSADSVNGSARVVLSGHMPGFYMSRENCDAMAKHLPVTWRPDIGFYVWNTADARYKQITSSPAYLGFVFSDRAAKNVTVKVPFASLINVLDTPIVDKQTPYFPCQPLFYTKVMLGRSFMQNAFIASNFATNITYIAQGPGPNVAQSVTKAFPTDGSALSTSPSDTYSQTWSKHWTPITSDIDTRKGASPVLSAGSIAGIIFGAIVGLGTTVLGGLWWFWRQHEKRDMEAAVSVVGSDDKASETFEADSNPCDKTEYSHETDGDGTARYEVPGPDAQNELGGQAVVEMRV